MTKRFSFYVIPWRRKQVSNIVKLWSTQLCTLLWYFYVIVLKTNYLLAFLKCVLHYFLQSKDLRSRKIAKRTSKLSDPCHRSKSKTINPTRCECTINTVSASQPPPTPPPTITTCYGKIITGVLYLRYSYFKKRFHNHMTGLELGLTYTADM